MPILTSPFPTTHDTIGASALDSPSHIPPSSPPSVQSRQSVDKDNGKSLASNNSINNNNQLVRETSNEAAITDLDKRLAQYTVDFNKFPGGGNNGRQENIQDAEEEDDAGPEFGGPEDFTFNIDKYLNDTMSQKDRSKNGNDPDTKEEEEEEVELPESPSPRPRHHRHHEHQDEADESEFGPPVDMSTPSHLMWRKNLSSGKEETRLEDIEESLPSSPEKMDSPSKGGKEDILEESRTFTTVLREIEDLQQQRHERDEKIRENEKKLAAAAEEIQLLRDELQHKSSMLLEANKQLDEGDILREQLRKLKEANEEKATATNNESDLNMRKELEDAREQLNKRDEALEDSSAKLRDLAAKNELQLRQKNSEIEDLKAQINERDIELADAEEELAEAQREYDVLKDRIASLETRNNPLEEKNILLEKELSGVRSELTSLKMTVSTMATDLSVDIKGENFNEIIGNLKQYLQGRTSTNQAGSTEKAELQSKLNQAQSALQKQTAEKELVETEWKRSQEVLAESRSLITTIEGENTRLTARIQELNSNLIKTREDMSLLKGGQQREQTTTTNPNQINTLNVTHRLEIQNLRDIHANATNDLRTSYNDTIQHLRSMLSVSEKRQSELHSQLITTKSTTNTQTNEISSLKARIQQLESTLSLKEETSAEMDKMISRSIEKREREWERRTELLLKERDKMGKALMYAWGEKEVGKTSSPSSNNINGRKGDVSNGAAAVAGGTAHSERSVGNPKQGYRYKYIVRP